RGVVLAVDHPGPLGGQRIRVGDRGSDDVADDRVSVLSGIGQIRRLLSRLQERPRLSQPPLPVRVVHRLAGSLPRHAAFPLLGRAASASGGAPTRTSASRTRSFHHGSPVDSLRTSSRDSPTRENETIRRSSAGRRVSRRRASVFSTSPVRTATATSRSLP